MKNPFDTFHPEGFGTVSSYLMTENPEELIEFLKNAFYAIELNRSVSPKTGDIANVIMKIGSSCFMISQAKSQFLNMRTAFYLYVNDVDAMHKRAIKYGAKVEFEPADMSYEDRQSGIIDPSDNYWWISKRLVESNYQ